MRFSTLLTCLAAVTVPLVNAATFVVQVGNEGITESVSASHTVYPDPVPAWHIFKFYPSSIDINVGDIISFEMTAGQRFFEHTVNFNPSFINPATGQPTIFEDVGFPIVTGVLPNGAPNMTLSYPPYSRIIVNPAMGNLQPGTGIQKLKAVHNSTARIASGFFAAFPGVAEDVNVAKKFEVTFTEAGSFTGYCLPHAQGRMIIQVNVRASGAYPKNATQIAAETAVAMAMDKASSTWRNRMYGRDDTYLKTVPTEWFGSTPSTVSNSVKQYFVRAGIWSPVDGGMASLARFVPDNIHIFVGDVLHFYAEDIDAHTVTIHNGTYNGNFQIAPGGVAWPDFPSTPGNITHPFQMKDYANSGFILGEFVPGPPFWMANPFSVQFTQAGTFHLTCLIHEHMGMEGTIYVRPAADRTCAGDTSVVNINFANMFSRT